MWLLVVLQGMLVVLKRGDDTVLAKELVTQ
jgi:hypothetical protein